jgi:hypothetical protein
LLQQLRHAVGRGPQDFTVASGCLEFLSTNLELGTLRVVLARRAFECLCEVRADLVERLLNVSVSGGQLLTFGLAGHAGALEVFSRFSIFALQELQLFLARVERVVKRVTFELEMPDLFLHLGSDAFLIEPLSGKPLLEKRLVLARLLEHSGDVIDEAPLSILALRARAREIVLEGFPVGDFLSEADFDLSPSL